MTRGDDKQRDRLDRISLEQALLDVELANARVGDLTVRLLELTDQLAECRRNYDELRIAHTALLDETARQRGSAAFRIAERIWALRNVFRG